MRRLRRKFSMIKRGNIMIQRDLYLQKIIDYMWDGQIKVITGIRRAGKSTLLFDLFYGPQILCGHLKEILKL